MVCPDWRFISNGLVLLLLHVFVCAGGFERNRCSVREEDLGTTDIWYLTSTAELYFLRHTRSCVAVAAGKQSTTGGFSSSLAVSGIQALSPIVCRAWFSTVAIVKSVLEVFVGLLLGIVEVSQECHARVPGCSPLEISSCLWLASAWFPDANPFKVSLCLVVLALSVADWHVPHSMREHKIICALLSATVMSAVAVPPGCSLHPLAMRILVALAFCDATFGRDSDTDNPPELHGVSSTWRSPKRRRLSRISVGCGSASPCSIGAADSGASSLAATEVGTPGSQTPAVGSYRLRRIRPIGFGCGSAPASLADSLAETEAATLEPQIQSLGSPVQAPPAIPCSWSCNLDWAPTSPAPSTPGLTPLGLTQPSPLHPDSLPDTQQYSPTSPAIEDDKCPFFVEEEAHAAEQTPVAPAVYSVETHTAHPMPVALQPKPVRKLVRHMVPVIPNEASRKKTGGRRKGGMDLTLWDKWAVVQEKAQEIRRRRVAQVKNYLVLSTALNKRVWMNMIMQWAASVEQYEFDKMAQNLYRMYLNEMDLSNVPQSLDRVLDMTVLNSLFE